MSATRPTAGAITPVNQVLTPMGRQVDLPGMRPQAVALSPDGKLLVTAGKTSELIVVDPDDATIRQRVTLPRRSVGDAVERPSRSRCFSRTRKTS